MCNLYWQSLEQKVEFATVVKIFSQKVKVDDGALPILYNLTFFCITLPSFYAHDHGLWVWKIWNGGISENVSTAYPVLYLQVTIWYLIEQFLVHVFKCSGSEHKGLYDNASPYSTSMCSQLSFGKGICSLNSKSRTKNKHTDETKACKRKIQCVYKVFYNVFTLNYVYFGKRIVIGVFERKCVLINPIFLKFTWFWLFILAS